MVGNKADRSSVVRGRFRHFTTLASPLDRFRWRVLLEDSGCEDINAQDKISILTLSEIGFLGWFLNSVSVFRMGFIYRCYQLTSRLKARLALVAGSLFAERILDTVVTLGLLGFAALFLLSSYWNPVLTYILLGGVVLAVVLAGVPIAMVVSGRSLTRFLPAKFRGGYDNFREGTIKSFRPLAPANSAQHRRLGFRNRTSSLGHIFCWVWT